MPGSGKQPQHVQEHVQELLKAGFDPTTIHKRLKVGRSSVYRMKKSLQQYGTTYAPPETNKKYGRPRVLTSEQEIAIRDWLKIPSNRDKHLDDLVWHIHQEFNIVCSITTVSKMKRKWLRVIEDNETNGHALPENVSVNPRGLSESSTSARQHDIAQDISTLRSLPPNPTETIGTHS